MASHETTNKTYLCNFWGVTKAYIDEKVATVRAVLHVEESQILSKLNAFGFDTTQVIRSFTDPINTHHQYETSIHQTFIQNRKRKRFDRNECDDVPTHTNKRRKVMHEQKEHNKENQNSNTATHVLQDDTDTKQSSVSDDVDSDSSSGEGRASVFASWRYKSGKSLSAAAPKNKQKHLFSTLRIKYTICVNKNYKPFLRDRPLSFDDIQPLKGVSDLYKLRSMHCTGKRSYDKAIVECEYDDKYKHAAIDEVADIYDQCLAEISQMGNKTARNKTIQVRIKKTKELTKKSELTHKRYVAVIEISLNKSAKEHQDTYVVYVPATIALTASNVALTNSVMEDRAIAKEYTEKGHQNTSISLLDFACRYNDNEELIEEGQERYGLNVIAFPYQVQSIEWMIQRETDEEGLYKYLFTKGAFKNGDVFYYSAVLNRLVLTDQLTVLGGGFLCEEMGLGKTIECLAVIHCNRRQDEYSTVMRHVVAFKETALRKKRVEVKQNTQSIPHKKKKKKVYRFVEETKEYTYYKAKGTLIIAPVSLIGQWEHEVDTRAMGITYKRYYGNRSRDMNQYIEYDVIFTTYGVLGKEDGHDRKNHVLHRIQWHRIILDEAHYIKNGSARTSININQLVGQNKWLLSGTPFNKPVDLVNQLAFLGLKYMNAMGLSDYRYSKALIKVVKYMMMRHTKQQQFNGKAITTMPEKAEDVIYVEFDAKQREYYDKLYATAKQVMTSYKETGNISRGFIPILSSLHPARQACSGYIADMNSIEKQLSDAQQNSHKIRAMVQRNKNKSSKELYELARVEAYNKDGQCVICLECPPDEPLQTPCRHVFCGECITAQLEANGECPICRTKTDVAHLQLPPSEKKEEEKMNANNNNKSNDADMNENVIKFDAKLNVLIQKIKDLKNERPDDKSLIFTSFSKSLDWICCELKKNDIQFATLTGSMTMNKRAKNLKQFSTSSDIKVFVLTVRTGAVGLTLTAANHVFMMEPTFNPALHRQAINRVYRLGQKKKVFIHTLIMKDSIEESIWKLNKDKQIGNGNEMYGNIKDDKAAALPATDIEKLFTI
eukprot:90084_1